MAYLQSNLFWQVSCAKSKTKASTEISTWTETPVRIVWKIERKAHEDRKIGHFFK